MERAILSERLNWQILPHEMEEMEISDLRWPLYLLRIFRAGQVAGRNLEEVGEDILAVMDYVRELKSQDDD